MKKFLLFLFLCLTSISFGQNVDIWKKNKIQKLFSTRKFTFPKNFVTQSPSGKTITYEKVEHPNIKIETSSGKKWTKKPIIYKSKEDFGVITYDGKNWQGIHTEDGNTISNLDKDKVTNVKMDGDKFHFNESGNLPIPPTNKTPNVSSTIINPDFYNQYIRINKTCGVYVEVTNDLFRFWGSDTSRVTQYVTTIVTNVIALYDREGINVTLNKIYVWDTPDPYGNPFDNSQYLQQFTTNINQNRPTAPEAHFKHLLHNKNLGGIAWVNGNSDGYSTIPSLDPYYTCAVTGIGSNIVVNSNTTYSWPVMCFTHEMGHNLGSKHTHWCGWKNDVGQSIGRLDSCYRGESSDGPANCTSTTYTITKSTNRGSIMSYCNLIQGGAISFTTGFGRYPRYAIRSNLFASTEIPFDIFQSPTVSIDSASQRTATSALLKANVISDGGLPVQERGFVWGLNNTNPTLDLTTKVSVGSGLGQFQHQLIGLAAGGKYFVRGYSKNASGISYSDTISFKLPSTSIPSLTTTPITLITNSSAQTGGTYITVGNSSILERGIVLSTSNQLPTDSDTKVVTPSPNNSNYISTLTGLIANTTYYIRAFARNGIGTSYGNVITFTTLPDGTVAFGQPSLTASSSTQLSASVLITSTGGGTITERGFFISTSPSSELTGAKRIATLGQATTMSLALTGLTPNTLYHVKGYATTQFGTFYSNEISLSTLRSFITLDSIIRIESTNATFKYTIGPGVTGPTSSGILVSSNNNPTRANSLFFFQSNYIDLGQGTIVGTGLLPNTTYFARGIIQTFSGDLLSNPVFTFTTTTTQGTPFISTSNFTSRTPTSITIGGEITNRGTSDVITRGICYSTAPNPTIQNTIINSGTGIGQFSVTIDNLSPATIYYIRAFATNKSGTSYGNEINVETFGNVPMVETFPINSISLTTANGGGEVTNTGKGNVTSKGIIWSNLPNPTINLTTKTNDGTGLGVFNSAIINLRQNTKYYVRAYAINENGAGYGEELSFTTLSTPTSPNVITNQVTNINPTSAVSGGLVTSDGGSFVTQKGICWSTSQNPTINLPTRTINGSDVGPFEATMTNLTLGVTYYVRAYATNSRGTTYGNQLSFTTTDGKPTVTTTPISSVTITSASSGGNITSSGSSPVNQRGLCWNINPNPTINNFKSLDGTGVGAYKTDLLNLTPNTTYYVRSYATNSSGTSYGNELSFTTFPFVSGSCQVSGLNSSINTSGLWNFSFNINNKCSTYSVNVCRYNYGDPNKQPPPSVGPISCGVRNGMNNYVPSSEEITSGLILKDMSPQPTASTRSDFGGWWYSIDVRCGSQNCIGTNLTKYYFYVPGL
jgi:hypothetical protein